MTDMDDEIFDDPGDEIPSVTMVVNCIKDEYDIYIGRGRCPKTGKFGKWGNPFVIGKDGTREEVIEKFRQHILSQPGLIEEAKKELKGKRLGCFCKPNHACHGDVLAEIAEG